MSKMKNSGYDYIGNIPLNWNLKKIKYVYSIHTGFTPDTSRDDYYTDNPKNTWISIADLTNNVDNQITDSSSYISDVYLKEKKPKITKMGSLLYSFKLSVGKTAFAGKDLYTNEAIASFENNDEVCLDYLNYASFLIEQNANKNIYNALILNQGLINNSITIIPPIEEQKLIANFLDKHIEIIDNIINDLEKQISSLTIYKESIITEKLLNNSNVKTSDVDGHIIINNICSGWKCGRIKDVLSVLTDYTANGSFQSLADNVEYLDYESYARLVRLTDLRDNLENIGIYVNEDSYNYLKKSSLNGGEVLVANVGAYAGLFCLMPNIEKPATLGPNMFLLKTNKLMKNKYLYYLGLSKFVKDQLLMKSTSSAQPKLNKEDVKTVKILIPPIDEQEKIIKYLDKKCKDIDKIVEDKSNQKDKMEKYKQSVIYEYVTGKKRVEGAEELYG